MPDKIKDAYNAVKSTGLFIDEADFREQVAKDKKAVFELFNTTKSTQGLFIDEADFDAQLGLGKQPASPSGNGGASSSVQSTPPVTPSTPNGNEQKIKELTAKATEAAVKGDTVTLNSIKGQLESLKKPIPKEQVFKSPIAQPIATSAQEAESQQFKEKEAAYNEAMVGEIKRYGEVMQNKAADEFAAISQTPMTEISAAYNNATKFDDESAKQYLEGLKGNLVNDYLTYLDQAQPEKAQATRERIKEIENKTRGEKNIDEQEFLFKLEKDALELKAFVANREAKNVIQSMDYDAYNVDATMLDEKIKSLAAERSKYVDANGTPKNSLGGKYQEYSSQIEGINKEMEAISAEFSNYVGEDGVLKDESKRGYVEGLQQKATALEAQANDLQKNYSYLFENGKLKQTEEEKKAAMLTEQINQLATQHESLAEKYGVSQEKLDLINQAATFGNQVSNILTDGLSTDYPELKSEIDKAKAQEAKSLEFTQKSNEGEEVAVGLGLGTWNAVKSGAYSAMQFPKIALDLINKDVLGNEKPSNVVADLLATDLYDMAAKGQYRMDSQVLNYGEGNETPYFVKKAELLGAGVGSVLTFIAGGEALSAVQVPKMMALWGTAYVTQEGDNYREALKNGFSPSDARLYSNLISAASATVELAIPDYKYIDDVVKPSVIAAYRAGTSIEESFKNAMKEFPKSLANYLKESGKEGAEEGIENIVVDAVKNAVNGIEGAEAYKDLFNANNILDAITAGAMVGGAMTALNRPDPKSPTQQSLIGAIAETTEEDVLKMATIAPENVAVITEIQGIGAGMRQLPSFTALDQTEKNFVISESFRKKQLQRAQKEAGVKDPNIEAEIEKIDNDVEAVFSGKKVGEEYEVELNKDEKVTNVVGNEKIEGDLEPLVLEKNNFEYYPLIVQRAIKKDLDDLYNDYAEVNADIAEAKKEGKILNFLNKKEYRLKALLEKQSEIEDKIRRLKKEPSKYYGSLYQKEIESGGNFADVYDNRRRLIDIVDEQIASKEVQPTTKPTAPISTQSGIEAVQSEEIVPEGVLSESTPIVKETEVQETPVVDSYDGMFNENKTGISSVDDLIEDDGYNFFYKNVKLEKVMMSPDEYLQKVREGQGDKEDKNVTDEKKNAIKEAIDKGNKINAPFLSTKDGKFSQEGRNRAVVAKERGEKMIPVFVESDVTFEEKIERGKELVAEAMSIGKNTEEEIISHIANNGLHRDGVNFIKNNYNDIIKDLVIPQAEAQIEPVTEPVETKVEETQEGTEEVKVEETVIEEPPIQEPPTPPTDEIDFDKGKGEEKEASRAKRIAEDESYRTKLNDYVKKYTSINVAAISELVEDYLPKYKKLVEEVGTKEANQQTVDFLLSLIANDVIDRTEGKSYTRSAFAMLAAQRIIREAMETGDTDTATTFNTIVDELGRQGGTLAALNNSGLSLDPLLNLFKELNASQKTALSQKTKSGRTKQDVLDEIKEESDSIKKDAAEELAKDESLDEAVTKVTEEPKSEAKVKPSKRTRLVKERADALDALKKIAFGQGLAATPKQGAQKSKELADAVIKIAKVEIQLGAYTLGEAVSKVYKQVRNYVSKQTVQEILGEVWDSELIKLSNESRREEALEVLSDAIEGRSADKLFKALAKAMKIVNPDFIKAQKKGRRITDKQALQEILADKELAETLLNQAIEHIRAEMEMNGTYLDSVQATKPSNMSDEQWNALRAKYVISKFKQFAQTVLETAEAKKEEVEIAQVVKDVAKQFYSKPTTDQSIHEALQAALPNLTLPQINKIAELVEERMQKLVESRDNRRIKALVKDITDGKNDSDMMKVLAKAMWNRGAMSTFQFANLLSSYLGFKGIPQNVVSQLIALLQNTAKMPSPLARQMAMKKVNNIATVYGETVWSFAHAIFTEVIIRNVLGAVKTAFTGALSVVFTMPRAYGKQFIQRPIKASRAFGNSLDNLISGRFAVKQALKDTFINHQVPIGRELPSEPNPYAKDRAWIRARNTKLREIRDMWNRDKSKAISYGVAKALIGISLQGKYVGATNTVNDLMGFLDYMGTTFLRDFYLGIEIQRELETEGVKMDARGKLEWKRRMSLTNSQLRAIDKAIDDEIAQMTNSGMPIPKDYKSIRKQQLIAENQNSALLKKAHDNALNDLLMGEPTTAGGATVRAAFKKIETLGKPDVEGQMNMIGAGIGSSLFLFTMFSRILIVMGEAGLRNVPFVGQVINMFPYEFTAEKGAPSIKRNEKGEKIVKFKDKTGGDLREYTYRMVASSAVLAAVAMFLAYAFDDEEVVDKNGNPILDKDGNKIYRQRYNLAGIIDFYGNSPNIPSNEKGTLPRNVVRVWKGNDENGYPIYKDYPIETATPALYGILKAMCEMRDEQRYFDEKVVFDIKDGKQTRDFQMPPRMDLGGLAMSASINSFNADFNAIVRIVNGVRADRGIQAGLDVMFFDPAKRLVSPRQMEEVTHQLQSINDQERIYMDYKLADDGMEGIVEYLMKDTWFTDPFIPNRENFESKDPFGFPVKFPPMYSDFLGMFGTTATYAMAAHEQEHKEYYNLYKDEKGIYDPQKHTFPKRFIYSKASVEERGEVFNPNIGDDAERIISDAASTNFRELIDISGLEKIANLDYEERMNHLDYLWSLAKYKAVKDNVPNSTVQKPKRPKNGYMMPSDIEAKNARYVAGGDGE